MLMVVVVSSTQVVAIVDVVLMSLLLLLLLVVVVALLTLGVGHQEGEGLRENSKVKVSGWEIITQDGNCDSIIRLLFD